MRIQPVTEVITRQQQYPNAIRKTDSAIGGGSASLVSFEECLKSQLMDTGSPAVTRRAEVQVAGAQWGYYMHQVIPFRSELKLKTRSNDSLSDD